MSERIIPGRRMPALTLPRIDSDEPWSLHDQSPENFTLLIAYRGYHCPLCKKQLEAFAGQLGKFEKLGVSVVAMSCDDRRKAGQSAAEWSLGDLPLAYGLKLEEARELGLYLSGRIKEAEPGYFSEPGLFLVTADGVLHSAWVQTVPFARPSVEQVLDAVKFTLENDYPPRGDVPDEQLTDAA